MSEKENCIPAFIVTKLTNPKPALRSRFPTISGRTTAVDLHMTIFPNSLVKENKIRFSESPHTENDEQ